MTAENPELGELPTVNEHVFSAEEKAEIFRSAVEDGVNEALQIVKNSFENSPETRNNLTFHNTHHTTGVLRRYDAIMNVLKNLDPTYTERAHGLGRFAAAYHDVVQKWEPEEVESTILEEAGLKKIMRKRHIGANETASTELALLMMDRINTEAAVEVFTEADKVVVRDTHEVTVPKFSFEKKTVVQPNLHEHSPIVTRAIALADLGCAGMDGPQEFLTEGDALFREENIDISEALNNPQVLTETQISFFRKRMLNWSEFQGSFAKGRKELLEDELLRHYPETARKELLELFSKFDESIDAARNQALIREKLSFLELARDMGYVW